MEIYQLHSFIAISKTGNLTRAAKLMNISQSAMSSQIKALEGELNMVLFKRKARGMQLTKKGRQLLEDAVHIVRMSEKMKQKAADLQDRVAGELNIGINTDPEFLQVSDISRKMKKFVPGVNLSFIETQTFETIKMLKNEQVDVGFHYGSMDEISIYSVALSRETICIVLPIELAKENMNASIERLVTLPWVWTRHGCPFHDAFQKNIEKKNLRLNQVTDAVEENIVRELVKSGAGAALMRKDEARQLVEQGTAAIWRGFKLKIPLGIACLDKRKNQPIISGFFKIIQQKYNVL